MAERGPCPFCRLELIKDDEAQTIAHEAPVCDQFLALMNRGAPPEVSVVNREDLPEHFKENAEKLKAAEMDETDLFRPEVTFYCPFCQGLVQAGETKKPGQSDSEAEPAVMHKKPSCRQFNRFDVEEYMQKVNDLLGDPKECFVRQSSGICERGTRGCTRHPQRKPKPS